MKVSGEGVVICVPAAADVAALSGNVTIELLW